MQFRNRTALAVQEVQKKQRLLVVLCAGMIEI